MKRDFLASGRQPAGVCCAALTLATRVNRIERSKEEIRKVCVRERRVGGGGASVCVWLRSELSNVGSLCHVCASLYLRNRAFTWIFVPSDVSLRASLTRRCFLFREAWAGRPSACCAFCVSVFLLAHPFFAHVCCVLAPQAVKVCDATVRKRLLEFEATPTSQLTVEELNKLPQAVAFPGVEEEEEAAAADSLRASAGDGADGGDPASSITAPEASVLVSEVRMDPPAFIANR